ncbi:MAG: hypothetical protein ACI379_01700 [Nocardioides sp.]|uniref:hypothetical protein n=1 Tax=Nocardioides sp. TaxID=35761 RepID=UPI003F028B95
MARLSRRHLLVVALVVVLLGAVGATVLPRLTTARDAQAALETYVDLVATGEGEELVQLAEMSASDSPAAMRTAVELLDLATERIEVVSVGDVEPLDEVPDVAGSDELDSFVAASVRYRLDGQEHARRVVLGRLAGERGDHEEWRVVEGLVGSLGDSVPEVPGILLSDLFLGGVHVVRRPSYDASVEETEQPLFAAVYERQQRIDPWFTSSPTPLSVVAGEATPLPSVPLEPTKQTEERAVALTWRQFANCRPDYSITCPVSLTVAIDHGVVSYDWWRGWERRPDVELHGDQIRVTGARLRMATPDGIVVLAFDGTATVGMGSTGRPVVDRVRIKVDE